jgi:hypothetical protein
MRINQAGEQGSAPCIYHNTTGQKARSDLTYETILDPDAVSVEDPFAIENPGIDNRR